jgi:hypothetical protein
MLENLDTIGGLAAAVIILYAQQQRIWKSLERIDRRLMRVEICLNGELSDDENKK